MKSLSRNWLSSQRVRDMTGALRFSLPCLSANGVECMMQATWCSYNASPVRSSSTKIPPQGRGHKALDGIKHIIAVASGKGGVGKSTISANLAVEMARREGMRVGLMDADVYGPSQHRMMNLKGQPEVDASSQMMVAMENFGIKCISMGNLMEEGMAAVWRGPMVMSAIQKLLKGTCWGELDVLVIDMPPGTGDAHLSISQSVQLSGAVVVSTPQDIALIDARRAITMFNKVNVPILGLVQNMSHFECPSCGHQEHIFGKEGVTRLCRELGVDLLGEVPLSSDIREHADGGIPLPIVAPLSPSAKAFVRIADMVLTKLDAMGAGGGPSRPRPSISMQ